MPDSEWTTDPHESRWLACSECEGHGQGTVDTFGDGPDRYRHHEARSVSCGECSGTGRARCEICPDRAVVVVHGVPVCECCLTELDMADDVADPDALQGAVTAACEELDEILYGRRAMA